VDDLLRCRDVAGFRAAAYLLRRAANLPLEPVAGMFGISWPRVSRIQDQIESGRVDRRMGSLPRRFNLRDKPRGRHTDCVGASIRSQEYKVKI